jgi:hypothetical protein
MIRFAAILLPLLLTGCVARSGHVSEGDRIVADLAQVVAQENPNAAYIAHRAWVHAQQDAAFQVPQGMSGALGKLATGDFVGAAGAGLAALAAAYGMRMKKRAMMEHALAKEVADMPPDTARKVLQKRKV